MIFRVPVPSQRYLGKESDRGGYQKSSQKYLLSDPHLSIVLSKYRSRSPWDL